MQVKSDLAPFSPPSCTFDFHFFLFITCRFLSHTACTSLLTRCTVSLLTPSWLLNLSRSLWTLPLCCWRRALAQASAPLCAPAWWHSSRFRSRSGRLWSTSCVSQYQFKQENWLFWFWFARLVLTCKPLSSFLFLQMALKMLLTMIGTPTSLCIWSPMASGSWCLCFPSSRSPVVFCVWLEMILQTLSPSRRNLRGRSIRISSVLISAWEFIYFTQYWSGISQFVIANCDVHPSLLCFSSCFVP